MDWSTFRRQFPAVRDVTYLNTAGGGAMSLQAAEAGKRYYDEAVTAADILWDEWLARSEEVRQGVARFIGADADAVAFVQNASLGMNMIARLFDVPVEVLATNQEFPSCTLPWIRCGHTVRFMPTPPDGRVSADDVENALTKSTNVFVLSSVQYANGYRADLEAIGTICRSRGVWFVVDATQSICAYDLNVERQQIDAVIFSGYKWATAGYGFAVMVLGPDLRAFDPPLVGWRSAAKPYLLENERMDLAHTGVGHEMGHPIFPGIFSLGASVKLFEEAGLSRVSDRIDVLMTRLRERLQDAGFGIISNEDARSGIALIEMDNAEKVAAELKKRRVYTSARRGGLRISVHAYNDERDVDTLIEALADVQPVH